jgi:hypothetical protein
MSQRHKNNSKWVKRQLSLNRDQQTDSSRAAIAQQLRIGERLRRKVTGDRKGDSEEEESDDEAWLEAARKEAKDSEIGQNLWAEPGQKEEAVEKAQGGLLGMKFMQRGAEKSQHDVRDLLEQLEDSEEEEQEDDAEGVLKRPREEGEDSDDAADFSTLRNPKATAPVSHFTASRNESAIAMMINLTRLVFHTSSDETTPLQWILLSFNPCPNWAPFKHAAGSSNTLSAHPICLVCGCGR